MVELKTTSRRSVKKGIDADLGRRRRDDTRVQIRKAKREEGLQKRRAMKQTESTVTETTALSTTATSSDAVVTNAPKVFQTSDIPHLVALIQKPDVTNEELLMAIQGFRKMLSVEKDPPVKEVLNSGAVPMFVKMLEFDNAKIQFEAAWALTNVASTDYTSTVVEFGAVPMLVQLLLSKEPNVREQCAWCLGNVAGDSPQLRDIVLGAGALNPLLINIANPENNQLLCNAVWALSNFCRGKPQPSLETVADAIPHLANLLKMNNKEALMDALWAISYLSDGEDARIQAVMKEGVVPTIVALLGHESASIITPAVRILGNFVSGNDMQTQAVIDAGVLTHINSLLTFPKRGIRKETCWLLSNIAAGNQNQIGQLMRSAQDMLLLVEAVRGAEWDVRKEATWVISNIATGGKDEHIHSLVEVGAIDALCSVLDVADARITLVVLDAIENILKVGKQAGRDYVGFVDECDGLDKIESLQEHANTDIYTKVVQIIESYFGVEEIEDENILPVIEGDSFAFGVSGKGEEMNHGEGAHQQQPLQPFNFTY